MKNLLTAASLALGLAFSSPGWAALGIQIDPDGLPGGPSFFASGSLGNTASTYMFNDCVVPSSSSASRSTCSIYGIGVTQLSTGYLSWGFDVPLSVWFSSGTASSTGAATISFENPFADGGTATGEFALAYTNGIFAGPNSAGSLFDTGTGFVDFLGDSTGATTYMIAEGLIKLDDRNKVKGIDNASQTDTAIEAATPLSDVDAQHSTTTSTAITSTFDLVVDITEQNLEAGFIHVINDLVNADIVLNIDTNLLGVGTQTPFTAGNYVADYVLGVTTDNDDASSPMGTDLSNDFNCGPGQGMIGGANGKCSFIGQSTGNIQFNAQFVPEPGTLALAGLALGLAGFASRRRRK